MSTDTNNIFIRRRFTTPFRVLTRFPNFFIILHHLLHVHRRRLLVRRTRTAIVRTITNRTSGRLPTVVNRTVRRDLHTLKFPSRVAPDHPFDRLHLNLYEHRSPHLRHRQGPLNDPNGLPGAIRAQHFDRPHRRRQLLHRRTVRNKLRTLQVRHSGGISLRGPRHVNTSQHHQRPFSR